LQLLRPSLVANEGIVVKTFNKGVSDTMIYDEAVVRERYGLEPSQLVDYKALVGDASDNIKGVPGVGPKTAVELIRKYDTIEKLYGSLGADPKLKERIGKWQKEAELSKRLVTLERHAPIEIGSIGELVVTERNSHIVDYFKELGFETLIKRLENNGTASVKDLPKNKQASMF
jgi:DNA polymerase I